LIGGVDEVVVNVFCGRGKVVGDLLDVWLWSDAVEGENEVDLDDDEEDVGDESPEAIEGSVIFLSLIGVVAMVMSKESEWVQVEPLKYCGPELQVQWVWPSVQEEVPRLVVSMWAMAVEE
jgi:hypothetical protein